MKLIAHALILAMLPACALAQGHADTVQQRNDCRLAVQIVSTGTPAPHTEWAYEKIASCGTEGAAALESAIRRTRQSRDVSALDAITQSARTLRDGGVYAVSLEVAADPEASVPARVFAFRTLISMLSPGRLLNYEQMTRSDVQRACSGLLPSTHDTFSEGRAMPASPQAAARDVAAQVAGDATAPPEVVHAARCAMRYTRS
jgi:hypothetical protein